MDAVITPTSRDDMVSKIDSFLSENLQAQNSTFTLNINGDFINSQYRAISQNGELTGFAPNEPYFDITVPFNKFKETAGNDYFSTIFSSNNDAMTVSLDCEPDMQGNFSELTLTYNANWTETVAQTQSLIAYAKEINASILNSSMNDYQKVKAIHDYLIHTYSYDLTFSGAPPSALISSRKFNCENISAFFYLLLKDAGLDSRIILNDTNNNPSMGESSKNNWDIHAWNMVSVDGKWYQIDVTWDECVKTEPYQYFLKSSATFKVDHRWDTSLYPVASTDYTTTTTTTATKQTTVSTVTPKALPPKTSQPSSSIAQSSSSQILSSSTVVSQISSINETVASSQTTSQNKQVKSGNNKKGTNVFVIFASLLSVCSIGGAVYFLKFK